MILEQVKDRFYKHVEEIQEQLLSALIEVDPSIKITEDFWQRKDFAEEDGGGGRTCFLSGDFIENAGANVSLVYGDMGEEFSSKLGAAPKSKLWAAGVSTIIHPHSPRIPTLHANFRMIQVGEKVWFGGGSDLTPYYPYEDDFHYFHGVWQRACHPYGTYGEWKETCDKYFVNKHRGQEMRGVGGIFFDHYNSGDIERDADMVMDISNSLVKSYFPIVEKRKKEKYSPADEDFQLYRRGRYVEFNLLHDRGTTFGLQSNGRTESILISLPARCKFGYNYTPVAGSPYEKMMDYYLHPRDWATSWNQS